MTEDDATDRRTVLRTLAGAGAASVGIGLTAGSAAAAEHSRHRFNDRDAVERLVEEYGEALQDALADHGFVDRSADLAVDTVTDVGTYTDTDAGGVASPGVGRIDGRRVATVKLRQRTDDYAIEHRFVPDEETAYAVVFDGDDPVAVVRPDGSRLAVDATGCSDGRCFGRCGNGNQFKLKCFETYPDGKCRCDVYCVC